MKVYKIKHKPTGLFYSPNTGTGNLTLNGKIYSKIPNLDLITNVRVIIKTHSEEKKLTLKNQKLVNHFNISKINIGYGKIYHHDKRFEIDKNDWKIIEY